MVAYVSVDCFVLDDYEDGEGTDEEYEEEVEEVNGLEIGVKSSDELACPFCSEDFDVLGLCCHIDADHRMEVKPGVFYYSVLVLVVFGWNLQ